MIKRKTEESAAQSFPYINHLTLFHPHFCACGKTTDLRALLTTRLGLQKSTFNFLGQNPRATLKDISDEKVAWFIPIAKKERSFPLNPGTPTEQVLKHLDLLEGAQPTNAAILLFGVKPQKFIPTAEIKCMHYHGTVVAKPIPSHQIFTGTLFDQTDQATDFILSKINRIVPPRDSAPVSEKKYEVPKEVIQEAVVNAVAHRDYTSAASVQVSVFSD